VLKLTYLVPVGEGVVRLDPGGDQAKSETSSARQLFGVSHNFQILPTLVTYPSERILVIRDLLPASELGTERTHTRRFDSQC
jgi:hypothetical protein